MYFDKMFFYFLCYKIKLDNNRKNALVKHPQGNLI